MLCEVCTNIDDDTIYTCCCCNVRVHTMCYGIDESVVEDQSNWLCSRCVAGVKDISCVFCVRVNGAYKPTKDGRWVHVVCALFLEGCTFEDENSMEPVDISHVEMSKNSFCYVCFSNEKTEIKTSQGAFVTCFSKNCNKQMHVTCSQKLKLIREVITSRGTIHFEVFCSNDHFPCSGSKRITAKGVKTITATPKKLASKALKEKSLDANKEWIANKVGSSNNAKAACSSSNSAIDNDVNFRYLQSTNKSLNKLHEKPESIITPSKYKKSHKDLKSYKLPDNQRDKSGKTATQNSDNRDASIIIKASPAKVSAISLNNTPRKIVTSPNLSSVNKDDDSQLSDVSDDSSTGGFEGEGSKQNVSKKDLNKVIENRISSKENTSPKMTAKKSDNNSTRSLVKQCSDWLTKMDKTDLKEVTCQGCIAKEAELHTLRLLNYTLQINSKRSYEEDDNGKKKKVKVSGSTSNKISYDDLPKPDSKEVSYAKYFWFC